MTTPNSNSITVDRQALLDLTRHFSYIALRLILQFSLSSLFFGMLTILAFASISLLLIPLLSTVILYASTTMYMAGLVWNWASLARIVSEANEGVLRDGYDGNAGLLALENAVLRQSWMVSVALAINMVLGDAVVWWRACVIWQNKIVYWTGPVLLGLTLAFDIIGIRQSEAGPLTAIYLLYGDGGFTDAAGALSLVTNLVATSLIAFKACFHRRRLKKYLDASGGAKTRVLKVLALFIESGSVYCFILVLVFVNQFNDHFRPLSYETSSPVIDAGHYFTYGLLTSVSRAIYPTVIIVLTAVNCSPLDSGLSPPGDSTGQAPSSHLREIEY
ncbi:hypothetical protein V8D89_009810, partial [Ganoderma adspersum]